MSKFHFNENIMMRVPGELDLIEEQISESNNKLAGVLNNLRNCHGFNIESAENGINEMCATGILLKGDICKGINTIKAISQTVANYSRLAYSGFYDLTNPFESIDNRDFHQTVTKYNNDTDAVIAGVFDGIIDGVTFKWVGKSDEYIGVEEGIDAILANLAQNNSDMAKEIYDKLIDDSFDEISLIKKLYPNLKNDEEIKRFFDIIGKLNFGVEISYELIASLAANYYSVHEYLDIMAETYSGDQDLLGVIERYRDTYEEKFFSTLKDMVVWAGEYGLKELSSGVLKLVEQQGLFPISSLNVIGLSMKAAQKIYHLDDIHSEHMKLQGIERARVQAQDAFNKAYEKLRSGNYTEEDVIKAQNLFDVYKSTLITEYETMISIEKAKLEKEITLFNGSAWNPKVREKKVAQYETIINEYYKKIEELKQITNPVIAVCR